MLGTADAHRQRVLEPEQPPHDHRPVRPRACPRHHQPVPPRLGRERPVPPVRRDPPVQIPGIPYKLSRSAHPPDATPLLRFSNTHPTRSPPQPGAIHPCRPGPTPAAPHPPPTAPHPPPTARPPAVRPHTKPRYPHPHHKPQAEFNGCDALPILFGR